MCHRPAQGGKNVSLERLKQGVATQTIEESIAVVRRHFDLLGRYDEAAFDAIWADDLEFREPQQVIRGREAGKKRYRAFREAFPDIDATLHEVVAQGDYVAVRYTLEGTHAGLFAGVPATGRRVALSGMSIFRLAGGRIAEGWGCADFFGFLRQLGALPAPPVPGGGGGHD
jgi:steroid delta-isomerase-like uncharacterized protein